MTVSDRRNFALLEKGFIVESLSMIPVIAYASVLMGDCVQSWD